MPAQCVGRDCESFLRTIHEEGSTSERGWQKPMKPILASHIRGVPLLDLLLFNRGRRFGEEIKRMDARSLTGSMALRSQICSFNT